MDGRTRFVVGCLVALFLSAWAVSLGRLIGIHFWDKEYALNYFKNKPSDPADDPFYGSTAFDEVNHTYFTVRYAYFLPHVIAALLWWNLYFFQLVPWIRRRYRTFHRYLGRVLMVTACTQVISGLGLACSSSRTSSTITILSFVLAASVTHCVYWAWSYAIAKDIQKHKHWAMRLVGHLQAVALARFWMVVLITSHQMGWHFLYPALDADSTEDEVNQVVMHLYDDSFVLGVLTAYLFTEWYLDAEQGWMMEAPPNNTSSHRMSSDDDTQNAASDERKLFYGSVNP